MPTTMRDRFNKVMGKVLTATVKATNGKVGAKMGKAPILLLTTKGNKSGKLRTSPLIYLADGDAWIVVASNAGQDHTPGWYHNLLANPSATVEVGGSTRGVNASVVADAERAALWPKLDAIYKSYATYRSKTSREIPIVRLTPTA